MKRTLSLIAACALLSGCLFAHENADDENRPDINVGVGAKVIYPGESVPAAGSGGSGSGAGDTANPPMMVGGTSGSASVQGRNRQVPLIGPLTALLGYPFWLFGKSIGQKADEEAEKLKQSPEAEGLTPDERERKRIAEENAKLQEELSKRSTATGPSRTSPASGSGDVSRSIGAELAALEASLKKKRASEAPPSPPEGAQREAAPAGGGASAPSAGPTSSLEPRGRREALDENGDGRVDLILVYDDQDRLVRSEQDVDGDGYMESIALHENGELTRKRLDTNGDGVADSWSFYSDGQLARHEVDRNSDGFRDLVLTYHDGRLIREEEDRNADGQPDVDIRYVEGDVSERHEDLDFDGVPDIDSYYENGKLVRREVRSEELLRGDDEPRS